MLSSGSIAISIGAMRFSCDLTTPSIVEYKSRPAEDVDDLVGDMASGVNRV